MLREQIRQRKIVDQGAVYRTVTVQFMVNIGPHQNILTVGNHTLAGVRGELPEIESVSPGGKERTR